MLTLSIQEPQGYSFGTPAMSTTDSASGKPLSKPSLPTLMNPSLPRCPLASQNSRRPKLSLQTSILPQPVSPALPLSCSADTPTTRNTLANSFRSPATGLEKSEEKKGEFQPKEANPVPYGPESTRRGILKNTPLTNLIRSRKQENGRKVASIRRTSITFVEVPQVIPRPPEDAERETEEDTDSAPEEEQSRPSVGAKDSQSRPNRPRSDSAEWRRLRSQRSANEGRELKHALRSAKSYTPCSETPVSAENANTPASADSDCSPDQPPQTPETPSPRHTRDWVWTLGDDFRSVNAQSASGASSGDRKPQGRNDSSKNDEFRARNHHHSLNKLSTAVRLGGSLPDTPSTATPVTPLTPRTGPSLPDTPVTPRSATESNALSGKTGASPLSSSSSVAVGAQSQTPLTINIKAAQRSAEQKAPSQHHPRSKIATDPLTPRSVPLPATPKFENK